MTIAHLPNKAQGKDAPCAYCKGTGLIVTKDAHGATMSSRCPRCQQGTAKALSNK